MLNFNSEFQRIATAAVGALVLTTTFVGAAVGPARAIETSRIAYTAQQGEVRVNA
ncbi:MAG TPA: hypothetical protein VI381_00900 [Allosphingosinicella sp.]